MTTDLAGDARVSGGLVDLGAYEYQSATPVTPLPTPVLFEWTSETNAITATWSEVDGASGYKVEYKESGYSEWEEVSRFDPTDVTERIDALDSDTAYDFRVTALSGDPQRHSDSLPLEFTLRTRKFLPPPTITGTNSGLDSITVSWNSVDDAYGYSVSYALSPNGDWSEPVFVQGLSWTEQVSLPSTLLSQETAYEVAVVAIAYEGDVDSEPATATVNTKILAAPTVSSSSSTAHSITVAWNPVEYATGYTVKYRRAGTSDWTPAEEATINGLLPETTYEVMLTATAGDYHSAESSPYTITTKPDGVEPVQLDSPAITGVEQQTITVKPNLNSAEVTWTAVANASSYTLFYKKATDSSWTDVDGITSTSYTIANELVGATAYNFKVVAKGDGSSFLDSAPSAVVDKMIQAKLATPTLTVAPGVNQATASWNAVSDASSYTLYWKKTADPDIPSNWSGIEGIMSASYTVDSLEGATKYDFKVVAKNPRTWYVDSDASNAVTDVIVKAKLAKPTISKVEQQTFTVKPSLNSATVTWTGVANASSYTLSYKKSSDSSWTDVDGITSTSYTIANELVGATEYNFKVVAKGDGTWRVNSDESAFFNKTIAAKLPTPNKPQVTDHTDTTITVKWDSVANAKDYTLQCVGGGQTLTPTTNSTTYKFTGLNPATQYTISVKANGDGVSYVDSDYSATTSQKTKETASVVVNSTLDVVDAYDGNITLREALLTYSAQGSTVTFTSNMAGKTINLNSQIALSSSKTINASALSSPVTVSGQNKTRIFSLSGTNQTYTITKVNFTQGKITSGGGGAINLTGSGAKLVVNNSAFTNNSELGAAGSSDDINSTGNFTTQGGGAIYVGGGARIEATNCTFTGNQTTQGYQHRGGAVHLYGESVGNFTACTFQNNKSLFGGAVTYSESCTGTMANCLIVKNEASVRGGGVAIVKNADVTLKNCTIVKNSATQNGGGVYVWSNSSHALVANCIVIQNSASSNPNFGFNSSMTTAPNIDGRKTLTGANVVWKSGNNLVYNSNKALFINIDSNWHLTGTGSQACNVGNNDYAAGSTDLDGNTRKRGGTVDLGCYEVQAGSSSALLDDEAELFDEMDDSLDLIAASLLGLE